MKLNRILKYVGLCCLTKVGLINGLSAEIVTPEKKAYTKDQEEKFLKTFGWTMGMQTGIKDLGLNEKELGYFAEGLKSAIKGEEAPVVISEVMEDLQRFLQEKSEARAKVRDVEIKEISAKNKKSR